MYSRRMTVDVDALRKLGAHIEARIAELGLEYVEVARLAGFSIEVLRKMRQGVKARSTTYRRLERALQWKSGTVQTVLAGGEPEAIPAPTEAPATTTAGDQPPTLSPDGEMFRRMVRAMAKEYRLSLPDAEEAVRLALQDYERIQAQERGLRTEGNHDTGRDAG